jgi:hypothetical protein
MMHGSYYPWVVFCIYRGSYRRDWRVRTVYLYTTPYVFMASPPPSVWEFSFTPSRKEILGFNGSWKSSEPSSRK